MIRLEKQSIQAIKQAIEAGVSNQALDALRKDERKGVQTLIRRYDKEVARKKQLHADHERRLTYERAAYGKGAQLIAGVDEVGRGPLAGPVVASAVILPKDVFLPGLRDSKQLSFTQREQFYHVIQDQALAIGIGVVEAARIDEINILNASIEAMKRAIDDLSESPDYLLVDAVSLHYKNIAEDAIIKGDDHSVSIAAASVIAKVTRDRMMQSFHETYPYYGFAKNQGYGTKEHLEGLASHGPSPIHRFSFQPVKNAT